MRRDLRILLFTLAAGAAWGLGSRVPDALASMATFRIREVEVTGLRYLERARAVELLELGPDANLWSDGEGWTTALARHPLVARVELGRRFPGTLVVHVSERRPVALVPTPVLEPVDAGGVRLPVDPADVRLDLPVVVPDGPVAPGARLVPASARRLLTEVRRLAEADTAFLQRISEVTWRDDGALLARWSEPSVDFLLPPGAPVERFQEGLTVLADVLARGTVPDEIDLRFADQVVVRRTDPTRP